MPTADQYIAALSLANKVKTGQAITTADVARASTQPQKADWKKVENTVRLMTDKQAGLDYYNANLRPSGTAPVTLPEPTKQPIAGSENPREIIRSEGSGGETMAEDNNLNIMGMSIDPAALGITGALGTAAVALLGTLASRTKFPWQTPEGEGFIAPWTNMEEIAPGLWGQDAVIASGGYSNLPATTSPAGWETSGITKAWTNAARDGSTPATAEYLRQANGTIMVRSMKTGQIRKYRPVKPVAVHSRMRLKDVARAQSKLDTLYKQIAKRTPLKRGK